MKYQSARRACGNFLVIGCHALRVLELKVLRIRDELNAHKKGSWQQMGAA